MRMSQKNGLMAAFAVALGMVQYTWGESRPQHLWNFDSLDWNSRQARDVGASGSKMLINGRVATGQGSFGSDALLADADGTGEIRGLALTGRELTFGCTLRFLSMPTGVRPVFAYRATVEASRPTFEILFDEGRLKVRMDAFEAVSDPLRLADGTRYALRVVVSADGRFSAWLDDQEVISRSGAPSPNAWDGNPSGKKTPTIALGGERGGTAFDGFLDDILLTDKALGAPERGSASADYSRIVRPEYRAVPAADASEALVFDANGKAKTGKFHVAETMDANVFGQMNKAASRYVDAAATAEMSVADGRLEIVVDCPVPAGETVQVQNDLWNGDYVEVDIRETAGDELAVCYCVNVNGQASCSQFGRRTPGWSPHAKMKHEVTANGYRVTISAPLSDVFGKPLRPGDTFGVNFIRSGRTCGGRSSWATTGGIYNDSKYAFGTAVVGGAEAFFRKRLAEARTRVEEFADDAAGRVAVADVCRPVEAAIAAHAGAAASFASLERMFDALERAFLAISLKGRPMLVYSSDEAWGNSPEPTLGTKPLEMIRIRTPRNFRSVRTFSVANFRSASFTGHVKFFDRYDGFYRTGASVARPKRQIARKFTLRRAVEIYDGDGRPVYDPLVDLPFGSVLEVAPEKTVSLFAELDTHGVEPGRYYGMLMVKSATPGFMDVRVGVEVTVTDDDPDVVPFDKFTWTHLATSFGAGGSQVYPATNCVRQLVARGYNVLMFSRIDDIYPTRDANGVWQAPSYEIADRYVDAWLAGGVDPQRLKIMPFIAVEREKPLWKGLRDHTGKRIPFGTPAHDEGLRAMVRFLVEHYRTKYGIGRDRIIWVPVDEARGTFPDPTLKSPAARCLYAGEVIRAENPANVLYMDPIPPFVDTEAFRKALPRFAEVYDILDLYRPKLTSTLVEAVQKANFRHVWTSHISGQATSPVLYRNCTWKALHDGFDDLVNYWHLDESASFVMFGTSHAYGSCYLDWDLDLLILSRRQLGADMAAEEGRLVRYLRLKHKDDPAKLAKISALVKDGAEAGTMAAMDAALEELLRLL